MIDSEAEVLQVTPGRRNALTLTVQNTRDVVDGVRTRISGIDDSLVTIPVPVVSVYPGMSGSVRVYLDLPRTFPEGEHEIEVHLTSTIDGTTALARRLTLVVAPIDDLQMSLSPRAARAGASTELAVDLRNRGNTEASIHVSAVDSERALRITTESSVIQLRGGESAQTHVHLKGRRPLFGQATVRLVTVEADHGEEQLSETFTFIQKPRIPGGVGTIVTLGAIVALWALVFTWAIANVLAEDASAKTLRTDFFTGAPPELDLTAITSTITGTIENASGDPIPRLTVSAIRTTADGTEETVSSAATDENGSYVLPVLPGSYRIRVEGDGFPTFTTDQPEIAAPGKATNQESPITTAGSPGTIRGQILVETGDDDGPTEFGVAAETWVNDAVGQAVTGITTTINTDGSYTLSGLETPATYRLTLSAEGYTPQTLITELDGGADVIVNTRQLLADAGSVRGLVTSNDAPLGGVKVELYIGETVLETTTPTSGADIGVYEFEGLVSPETYLIIFSADGFDQEAITLKLEPGAEITDADQQLRSGTGSLAGTVSGPAGPLGGVQVTVVGSGVDLDVQSLTAGNIGAWNLGGLPTPGDYVVTFTRDGFQPRTLAVSLGDRESSDGINAVLTPNAGAVSGTIVFEGAPTAGIDVTLTDGQTNRTTTSVTDPAGDYLLTEIAPGSYTLLFQDPDSGATHVALVEVEAGSAATVNASFEADASVIVGAAQ